MKVLKLVLNDSMDVIELFLDANRLTLKISTDNRLSAKQTTSVTLDHDETCELIDFLEQLEDEMSVNDFIDESPSDFTEDQYNYLKSKDWSYEDPNQIGTSAVHRAMDNASVDFPTSDDIQEWLSKNQDDNSEDKGD